MLSGKIISWIVVGLVVIGGAIWIGVTRSNQSSNSGETSSGQATNTDSSQTTSNINTSGTDTFGNLLSLDGNFSCTMSMEQSGATMRGTVYLSDKQVRGDFNSKFQSINVDNHMIQKDGDIYIWNSMSTQGYKMAQVKSIAGSAVTGKLADGSDLSAKVDYKCDAWIPDQSKFGLPTGINFVTFSSLPNS